MRLTLLKEIALGELRVILHAMCHKRIQCPKLFFFSPTTVRSRGKLYPGHLFDIAGTDYTCIHLLFIFYYIVGILLVLLAKKAARSN